MHRTFEILRPFFELNPEWKIVRNLRFMWTHKAVYGVTSLMGVTKIKGVPCRYILKTVSPPLDELIFMPLHTFFIEWPALTLSLIHI